MPFVNATYTGVNQVRRFHFSVAHGDTCSCLLDIIPQASLPAADGILVLTDGSNTLTIPGCRLDLATIRLTTAGHVSRVWIHGPTWHWKYGEISGVYNVPQPDGNVDPTTKKTVRELADLLFAAMQVPIYDTSNLPDDTGPFVNWRGANAHAELTWLCHNWGCDFGLDVQGTAARVWVIGQGAGLPDGGSVRSTGWTADLEEPPDYINVHCGPTEYELKFKLRPIAIDTDFSKKPLGSVSYNPNPGGGLAGWDGVDPWEPLGKDAPKEDRELAKKSLWRLWEIESLSDGTFNVPGYNGEQPTSIEDFLPLLGETAGTFERDDGAVYQKGSYLIGDFAVPGEPASFKNVEHEPVDVDFTLDRHTGIVRTAHPIFKVNDDLQYTAPELYIVAGCRIRRKETFHYDYHEVSRHLANNGAGALPVQRPDLIRRVEVQYNKTQPTGFTDNVSNLEELANAQLDAVQRQFLPLSSSVREYVGIAPISLDGAIRQVSIYGSCTGRDQGCFTTAARNTEWEPGLPRRRQRRLRAEQDRLRVQREIQDYDQRSARRGGVL